MVFNKIIWKNGHKEKKLILQINMIKVMRLITFNLFNNSVKIMTFCYNLINKFIFENSLANFVALF
jgi:hypothetical protein